MRSEFCLVELNATPVRIHMDPSVDASVSSLNVVEFYSPNNLKQDPGVNARGVAFAAMHVEKGEGTRGTGERAVTMHFF